MSTKPHSASKSGDPRPAAAAASTPKGHGSAKPPTWRQDDGAPVSCLEKIKVLNENYAELLQMAQDAFEDALLIGCSEAQVRSVLHELVDGLTNPYPGTKTSGPVKPQER